MARLHIRNIFNLKQSNEAFSHGIYAKRTSNQFKVKLNLTMKGKKNRVYPDLDVGDEVKICRKRKPNEKERVSNWSQNIYTIENIENKLGQKLLQS